MAKNGVLKDIEQRNDFDTENDLCDYIENNIQSFTNDILSVLL